ncbi:DegV family protein [Anaeromicropila populeti]|uniref:EDD domain protein, DegV family n=1 Tax=Anaeromicropila populeti TaxID=37658 RepID=A0A1I6JEW5_9FIRM|nr:DegV family protein [Anaeromicropila populeti]SFR77130.1 EDD domain protein, DegV family [Anaeromicropila populeti]
MSYKIIGDSCTDLPEKLKENEHFCLVPLSITIDGYTIIDDETFNQKDFLERMAASPNCPSSACPSPEDYMKLFHGEEDIFVVTLSSQLSGSYNSAVLAKNLYLEENPSKNIEIIDSRSASVGQTLIAMKIQELAETKLSFSEIVRMANQFRDEMETLFVLESLETLRKNGRLSGIKALIVNALNIKPIMVGTKTGEIDKADQARGMNKALVKMADIIEKNAVNAKNKVLAIAHCNNYERALFVKDEILKRVSFKDVVIVDTAGISSLYANDGGIIVCY